MSPEEKELTKKVRRYIDEVFSLNQQLSLLSELSIAAANADMIDGETIEALGNAIRDHIQKHRIYQHYFLNAEFPDVYAPLVAGEIARLEAEEKESSEFLSTNNNVEGDSHG